MVRAATSPLLRAAGDTDDDEPSPVVARNTTRTPPKAPKALQTQAEEMCALPQRWGTHGDASSHGSNSPQAISEEQESIDPEREDVHSWSPRRQHAGPLRSKDVTKSCDSLSLSMESPFPSITSTFSDSDPLSDDDSDSQTITQQMGLLNQMRLHQAQVVEEFHQQQQEDAVQQQVVQEGRLQELDHARAQWSAECGTPGRDEGKAAEESFLFQGMAMNKRDLIRQRKGGRPHPAGGRDFVPAPQRKINASRGHVNQRPLSQADVQAQRILEARAGLAAAEEDTLFWGNRVKMLKHEMERAKARTEAAARLHNIFEDNNQMNERIREALEQQRLQEERLLEAKRAVNQQRRQEQRTNNRQARWGHFEDNWALGEQVKCEHENNTRMIGQVRYEEFEGNVKRTEGVRQQRLGALMKRVQDRAEKVEQAHKHFEDRLARTTQQEEQKTQEAMALMQESAALLQQLQQLKQVQRQVQEQVQAPILMPARPLA